MSNEYITGSVLSVLRYPVKSMMGEELTVVDVREGGLIGDRAYGSLTTPPERLQAPRTRASGRGCLTAMPASWSPHAEIIPSLRCGSYCLMVAT